MEEKAVMEVAVVVEVTKMTELHFELHQNVNEIWNVMIALVVIVTFDET